MNPTYLFITIFILLSMGTVSAEIKVFSLNTWMLPLGISADNNERFEKIIEHIKEEDYDIICLQEVWGNNYLKKLEELEYNTYYKNNKFFNSGGLVILSKEKGEFTKNSFKTNSNIIEKIAGKGYLLLETKNFTVVNTHLDAYDKKISIKQFEEIKKLSQEKIILCGDFNLEKKRIKKQNIQYFK